MGGKLNAFANVFDAPKEQGPRNIDPLSPEGIKARKDLARYEASIKPEASEKPLTEGERKAAVLLEIAEPSAAALDDFDAPNRLEQYAGQRGVNEAVNAHAQVLNMHSLAVADAYIRLTSGANAPEPEVKRAMQMIVPRSGDSKALLQQKREMRQRMVRALRRAARVETSRAQSAAGAAGKPDAPSPEPPKPALSDRPPLKAFLGRP
jgi:hypothetical protein